jgi:hypothetical protein
MLSYKLDELISEALGTRGQLTYLLSESGQRKSLTDCKKDFEDILLRAIGMDLEMKMQRAVLRLDQWNEFEGFIMETDPMDADGENEHMVSGQPVGLVVRPALLKIGNWDGEGYQTPPTVLVKSLVMPQNALERSRGRRGFASNTVITTPANGEKKRERSLTRKLLQIK